jgi:hypothetical protein
MNLEKLIKGQKIRIDNHQRGSGAINNWDDRTVDVHIDKTAYYPKNVEVRIRIPLNDLNRGISMESPDGKKMDNIPFALQEEIQKTLGDPNTRAPFIGSLKNILKNYSTILTSEEQVKQALESLSKHFGLHWTENQLKEFAYVFEDDKKNRYLVEMDSDEITIADEKIADLDN